MKSPTCYYFDDIMKVEDIYSDDILLDKKSYENISIYDISYKNFLGEKPLSIWFKKIDWFIKTDNGISTPKSSLIQDTKGTKRSLSHRNKSVDFFCKSMDWFICDRERVNQKI